MLRADQTTDLFAGLGGVVACRRGEVDPEVFGREEDRSLEVEEFNVKRGGCRFQREVVDVGRKQGGLEVGLRKLP